MQPHCSHGLATFYLEKVAAPWLDGGCCVAKGISGSGAGQEPVRGRLQEFRKDMRWEFEFF